MKKKIKLFILPKSSITNKNKTKKVSDKSNYFNTCHKRSNVINIEINIIQFLLIESNITPV